LATRFEIQYYFKNEFEQHVAEVSYQMVSIDKTNGKPTLIPKEFKENLKKIEIHNNHMTSSFVGN